MQDVLFSTRTVGAKSLSLLLLSFWLIELSEDFFFFFFLPLTTWTRGWFHCCEFVSGIRAGDARCHVAEWGPWWVLARWPVRGVWGFTDNKTVSLIAAVISWRNPTIKTKWTEELKWIPKNIYQWAELLHPFNFCKHTTDPLVNKCLVKNYSIQLIEPFNNETMFLKPLLWWKDILVLRNSFFLEL